MTIKHIILASKSSVRKNLLSNSGIEFEVISSDYDEKNSKISILIKIVRLMMLNT